jgi:aminoglycoside phosphotransferase (APT) family kinase protein
MKGSLGEKIGEGAYSDVHAWTPGRVVKLFKPGFPRRHSWWEARMARAAFAAGAPAPEVFEELTLEGRFGVVLQRLDGPTLLQLSRSGAMTRAQTGAILASLARSVHEVAAPAEILSLLETTSGELRNSDGALPEHIATGVLTLIERLAPGDGLCHGDLHPGNVIMTPDGPRIVDWQGATRAPPSFDLACSQVLLAEFAPTMVADPDRPRAVNAALQSEYAELAGVPLAALTAAMSPYLPIVSARALLGPAGSPALRDRLIRQVEAALRPGG